MSHLDDGTLQAFLDDEVPAGDRPSVAEHLLGCEACHARYEELTQANALVTQSISLLDVEPVAARPRAPSPRSRVRTGTTSFVKAAGLVLALAAAASAAVPGSPVRQWVVGIMEPAPAPVPPRPVEETPIPAEPLPPVPAGLSISPAGGSLLLAVREMDGSAIHLSGTTDAQGSLSIAGAERDPEFRTGAGRLELRNGAGGIVSVRLPLSVDGARLEVDGRLYAESRNGALHLHVPADTVGEAFVW